MCYTEIGQLYQYREDSLFSGATPEKKLWDWVILAEDKYFKRIRLEESRDIWPAFKKLFGGKFKFISNFIVLFNIQLFIY